MCVMCDPSGSQLQGCVDRLAQLAAVSDVLIVTASLNTSTHNIINKEVRHTDPGSSS